jgi:hypothetical protein
MPSISRDKHFHQSARASSTMSPRGSLRRESDSEESHQPWHCDTLGSREINERNGELPPSRRLPSAPHPVAEWQATTISTLCFNRMTMWRDIHTSCKSRMNFVHDAMSRTDDGCQVPNGFEANRDSSIPE